MFNEVFSRGNLQKIKDGTYIINLEEYSDIGTHWVAFQMINDDVTYFGSFGVEHIPKEIKAFIKNKNIKTNIFRVKHMIQWCVDISALDLLILCLKGKLWPNIQIFLHQITLRRTMARF